MKTVSTNSRVQRVPVIALLPYLLNTFRITWGLLGLYLFLSEQATEFRRAQRQPPGIHPGGLVTGVCVVAIVAYRGGIQACERSCRVSLGEPWGPSLRNSHSSQLN